MTAADRKKTAELERTLRERIAELELLNSQLRSQLTSAEMSLANERFIAETGRADVTNRLVVTLNGDGFITGINRGD